VQWLVVDRQDRLPDTLEWMFAHKVDWLSRTGRDAQTLAQRKEFYDRSCGAALEAGDLVLIELLVDDVRVAAQIGFRAGNRLDCDMIAWDPAWRECGPGRALDVETIRWGFEHAIDFIELGVFGHESKYRFTDRSVDTAFDVFVPGGAGGRFLLASKSILKRARTGAARIVAAARSLKPPPR
jgi:CelD/BcsL family acetyltransferase involved in cellulose biosynthesis